jgi:hypothetical protein
VLIAAVGEKLQVWFAATLQEPISEDMAEIIRRIESAQSARSPTAQPSPRSSESEPETPRPPWSSPAR